MEESPKIITIKAIGQDVNSLDTLSLNLSNNKYGAPVTHVTLETGVSGCKVRPKNKALLLSGEDGSLRILAVACIKCALSCAIRAKLNSTYPYITT